MTRGQIKQQTTRKKSAEKPARRLPFYKRKAFLWPAGSILGLIILVLLAFRLSPWPGALVIRWDFNQNSAKVLRALSAHEPKSGVVSLTEQQYKPGDKDAMLDAYFPENINDQRLPLLIWTHGGAWLSGDKTNIDPYAKIIASKGYAVISLNYSLAPGAVYPKAVHQLNDAYAYILKNADRFHVDTNKIMLAGDSAGSQLSAQMAAIVTNPVYASEVGVTPSLKPEQLKGVVLNCGIYMMERLAYPNPGLSKLLGWGDDVTVWSYSGTHDFSAPVIREMSPYYHITKDFPATYITGGNADPLTDTQSKPFATKLESLGVKVATLFYSTDHTPALPHEYQFNLDSQDGQNALRATLDFMQTRVK